MNKGALADTVAAELEWQGLQQICICAPFHKHTALKIMRITFLTQPKMCTEREECT